ncbi:DNA-binding transcriptional regulator, LysR family [Ferrithrix thermotolerans DSM 19514]|uniref:DNA-binding transcriptional regulator, LysR family n=1 Tax=Ferrithrix thermotolerans DSM 19514 TaxID=1121881 RepID=A0A1M4SUR1_9ACTN|nr:DNA-binding transcriptional regulator, LysR family [Ferrithrix thermotolerans DSM 19514]
MVNFTQVLTGERSMTLHRLQRVSSDYLVTLVVVAETENLSEAASLLGISQPAVSQQLKALSQAVGERLHERSGHGVTLTRAGRELARESAPLLRGYRGVMEYLSSLEKGEAGVLSVAASNTVAAHVLPNWLIKFRRAYPGVRVSARSTNSELVVSSLDNGEMEVGLIESPEYSHSKELVERVIGGDELVLACSPSLFDFTLPEVSYSEIEHLPMVWRESGSGVRSTVEAAMVKAGIFPRTVFELAGGEAVKEALVAGLGVGFVSSLAVGREVEDGLLKLAMVKELGRITRAFRIISRPFDELSIPARSFYQLVVGKP